MDASPTRAEPEPPLTGPAGLAAPQRSGPLALRPLNWLALQSLLLLLGLISVSWNLAAIVLYPLLPRAAGRRIGRAMIAWGYGLFWSVARACGMLYLDADVLDALRDERGLIVVANHPSMLDALMLVARLPRSACIMKAALARNPLLGPGARLARYIRNDSTYGMVHRAVADLREGGQLVLFPEGTRTTRAPINDFHASFALIAKRARVPVQTVFIDTDSPYLGKGWPLWKLPPLPIRFGVRLGRRFEPPADPHALRDEVQAYYAAGVQSDPEHR
ncbi:MAG: 1-acyl-sn-glycerol-3-phosphate acyltransferase [Burkholderiales bacterium]|nr:1-acyl-sn-glycerol-3-phosphate acyltransferase [Burkholderiales bacterium]